MSRDGNRKGQRGRFPQSSRSPKTHYSIVTDGERTEGNYCRGLFSHLPDERKEEVVLDKVYVKQPNQFLSFCRELCNKSPNLTLKIWIIFDCDLVPGFDGIINSANDEGFGAAWSNPCIEEWFWMYFSHPNTHTSSTETNSEFRALFRNKTGIPYDKNDQEIYQRLNRNGGDEERAFGFAEEQRNHYKSADINDPSRMHSATTVDCFVKEVRGGVR